MKKKSLCFYLLTGLICISGGVPAALIQHLDATVSSSVVTNGSGVVTRWTDQSGNGNNATTAVGSVKFPGASLAASGLAGLDFGTNRNSLQLFSSTGSDRWLDQSSGTNGFCVLVAFKCDGLINDWNDLIGNSTVVPSGFGMRYSSTGVMSAYLGGIGMGQPGQNLAPGDTVVFAFNYNAGSDRAEFWDSRNYSSVYARVANADFSLSSGVTLGTTTGSGRFVNAMVGEVKVFNHALSVTEFQTQREALALKWAGISVSVPVSWRVIPEDPAYPENEAVAAGIVIGDPGFANPLPADPAAADCTATFQEALDSMLAAGGGTVFVPPGHYRFDGNLILPDGVVLRGRWKEPSASQPVEGTIFDIYTGRGLESDPAFLTGAGKDCGIINLAFWYPDQVATNIVAYPYTVENEGGMVTVENITLVNSCRGLSMPKSSLASLRGVYGSPLLVGFFADNAYAMARIEGINFSPSYWAWSGLPGAPATNGPQAAYSYANGTGMFIGLTGGYWLNSTVSGYRYGIVSGTAANTFSGALEFYKVNATDCYEALRLEAIGSLRAFGCVFSGSSTGVRRVAELGGDFYGCTISGGTNSILGDPGDRFYTMSLQDCTLTGPINLGSQAALQVVNSPFTTAGTNIILNSGVTKALVAGCTNGGPSNVLNNSGAPSNLVLISTNPVVSGSLPIIPGYNKVRKPDKQDLFLVTNPAFAGGAKGDGVADDTAPIQAALAAAATNGGGIVFFPAGVYRVTAPLNVSPSGVAKGVELRGVFGGRHGNDILGSLILIDTGAGNANGTPFITLGDHCGVRGLNFNYTAQNWMAADQIPYPYMIRAQGWALNYVIDCCMGNVYQGIDFNNARESLVDYCFMGGLSNSFRIRGGSSNIRIQNVMVKPMSWWLPAFSGSGGQAEGEIGKTADVFKVEECTNLTISSIFNHSCRTLFTHGKADGTPGGTGQALFLGGEGMQRGFVMETAPASGTFSLIGGDCNVGNCGDNGGQYGIRLKPNYTGSVSTWGMIILNSGADYLLSVENPAAQLVMNAMNNTQEHGIFGIRAAGKITLNGGYSPERFNLEVPLGGEFNVGQKIMSPMCNQSQPGLASYTNCVVANSYIAADVNEAASRPLGITMDTSNAAPIQVNAGPSPGVTRDPYLPLKTGWHLVSGSTLKFTVTDPEFADGANPNVMIEFRYLEDTDGSITVAYDSTNGMVNQATYTLSSTNGAWKTKSFTVNNARFAAADGGDIIVTVGGGADPVFLYMVVQSGYLGAPEQLPTARFTALPTNGTAPLPVTFTDQSEGSITNLLWDFGDGQTTNTAGGAQVEHVYQSAGSYTVTLIARGPGGVSTNTQPGCVTVNVPTPPTITGFRLYGLTNALLTGVGGPTNGVYYYQVLSSTNLMLHFTNWSVQTTSPFNADGSFSSLLTISPDDNQRFYRLRLP